MEKGLDFSNELVTLRDCATPAAVPDVTGPGLEINRTPPADRPADRWPVEKWPTHYE